MVPPYHRDSARDDPPEERRQLTNTIAIILALLLVAFFAYDGWQMDWAMTVFLGRKGLEFIEWLAFWR